MPLPYPAARVSRSPSPSDRRFKRILLVDDDVILLRLLTTILIDAGYIVYPCDSGVAAVETFRSEDHFDLLLSDLQMPKMDGITLANLLTSASEKLPVLIISGAPAIDVPIGELWRRNWCFLSKPTSIQLLLDTVDQLCNLIPIHMAEIAVMPPPLIFPRGKPA